jgi:hypothetical protein
MEDIRLAGIESSLPQTQPPSSSDLRALFERDRDQFFRLVTVEEDHAPSNSIRMLIRLARITAVLMRDGFELVTRSNQYVAEGARGGFLPIADQVKDARFLEQLWSKSYLGAGVRGVQGVKGTQAEDRFFYEPFDWIEDIRRMRLFRIDPIDATAVCGGLPKYHRLQLIDCAREVVACPKIIGEGLRSDGPLRKGQAYYGVSRRRWLNNGQSVNAPEDMLFVVYADAEGSVFDWDWKEAKLCQPEKPPTPTTPRLRVAEPKTDVAELLVGNVLGQQPQPFRPGHAWYSVSGDCVFCYFKETEAYEDRVDEFITKYVAFGSEDECVGFKLKYVSRLFDLVQRWSQEENEGITITFDPDSVSVDLEFLMRAWLVRSLPRRLPVSSAMKLIQSIEQNRERVTIPRRVLESV